MGDPIQEGLYTPHIMIYGDAGTMKSTFAATAPKPQLVTLFDNLGKDLPYLRRGKPGPREVSEQGVPYREVYSRKDDSLLIRIEYFHDQNVKNPKATYAYERYLERLDAMEQEMHDGRWASYVLDSCTYFQIAVFKYNQYKKNPTAKSGEQQDARQWYASVSMEAQELVNSRLAWLPIPVIMTAHLAHREDRVRGEMLYLPDAPGQTAHRLPAAFTEVWLAYVDDAGEHWLQTRKSNKYMATTQVNCPNPMEPHWKAFQAACQAEFGE